MSEEDSDMPVTGEVRGRGPRGDVGSVPGVRAGDLIGPLGAAGAGLETALRQARCCCRLGTAISGEGVEGNRKDVVQAD